MKKSNKTHFVGTTEFRANGTIKAFHLPTKSFKRVIIEANFGIKDAFTICIQIGNRDHIHDIQPREFAGVNLFDKYHGRQSVEAAALVAEAHYLWEKSQVKAEA